jgi:hypothetical protein
MTATLRDLISSGVRRTRHHPMKASVFVAALAGWCVLCLSGGGLDLGRLPAGRGAYGLALGAIVGGALATAAVAVGGRRRWTKAAVVAVSALGGLVVWSASSIAWASAPDLAWLTTNRLVFAFEALVLGVALGAATVDAVRRMAIGVSLAAAPVVVWSLLTRVAPELLAPGGDTARLAAPFDHANTLALIAVFAVPGGLMLVAEGRWRGAGVFITMCSVMVTAMTASRSGMLALMAAVAVLLWGAMDRVAVAGALGAVLLGALAPTGFALTAGAFTSEPVLSDPSERQGAGLVLGLLTTVGIVIAYTYLDCVTRLARRLVRHHAPMRMRRLIAVVPISIAGTLLVVASVAGHSADTSGPSRLLSFGDNNRWAWWGEAWRGFLASPLRGQGAGSFPLIHIAERGVGDRALLVRQPHQLGLEFLSELGLVGFLLAGTVMVVVAVAARRIGRTAAPAVAILVAFLIQAYVDIPWTYPAVAAPVCVAAGVVLATGPEGRLLGRSRAGVRIGGMALLALVTSASTLLFLRGELLATTAYLADSSRGVAFARAAADSSPLSIGALLIEARTLAGSRTEAKGIEAAREAVSRQPANPYAWECLTAVSHGLERREAVRRWASLDPRHGGLQGAACRPSW